MDHLLLLCNKARELWAFLFVLFGVSLVLLGSARFTLISWKGSFARKKGKKIWMAAPICLFWTIWRGRNRVVFDNVLKNLFCFGSLVLV